MKKLKWIFGAPALLAVVLYAIMFWWPRPLDTTEARVYASDGSELNYCNQPALDGNGPMAKDIPKAYSPARPKCYWERFPMPVLADCREPIAEGFPDLRGLWQAYEGPIEHVERIEQCGNRIVVTAKGIIHDFHADGTLAKGSRDVEGPKANCINTWVSIDVDENRKVNFHPFGISSVTVVKRWLENGELQWKYLKFDEVIKMKRICKVPVKYKTYSFNPV